MWGIQNGLTAFFALEGSKITDFAGFCPKIYPQNL
jgi:hypothetical protein